MGKKHKHCTDFLVKGHRKWYHPRVYVYATKYFSNDPRVSLEQAQETIKYNTNMIVPQKTLSTWRSKIYRGNMIISDVSLERAAQSWMNEDPNLGLGWYRGENHIRKGIIDGIKRRLR